MTQEKLLRKRLKPEGTLGDTWKGSFEIGGETLRKKKRGGTETCGRTCWVRIRNA